MIFSLILNATLAIFTLIIVGYALSATRVLRPGCADLFSDYVFYIALPAEIFLSSARSGEASATGMHAYLHAYCIAILILWGLIWLVYRRWLQKSLVETGLNLIAIGQTNTAFLAVPIFIQVFGDAKLVIPIIVLQSVVLTSASVFLMESASFGGGKSLGFLLRKALLVVIRNPLIIAALCGFLMARCEIFSLSDHNFFIVDSLQMIATTAAPLALISLGASFSHVRHRSAMKIERVEIVLGIVFKSMIHPAIAYVIGRFLFALTAELLFAVTLIAAMPSPKNTFIFAQIYGLSTQKFNLILLGSTAMAFFIVNAISALLYP